MAVLCNCSATPSHVAGSSSGLVRGLATPRFCHSCQYGVTTPYRGIIIEAPAGCVRRHGRSWPLPYARHGFLYTVCEDSGIPRPPDVDNAANQHRRLKISILGTEYALLERLWTGGKVGVHTEYGVQVTTEYSVPVDSNELAARQHAYVQVRGTVYTRKNHFSTSCPRSATDSNKAYRVPHKATKLDRSTLGRFLLQARAHNNESAVFSIAWPTIASATARTQEGIVATGACHFTATPGGNARHDSFPRRSDKTSIVLARQTWRRRCHWPPVNCRKRRFHGGGRASLAGLVILGACARVTPFHLRTSSSPDEPILSRGTIERLAETVMRRH